MNLPIFIINHSSAVVKKEYNLNRASVPAQCCALPLLYVKGATNIRIALRVEGILGSWEARRFRTKFKFRGVNR